MNFSKKKVKKEPKKVVKKKESEFSENILTLYCHFIYRYFGRFLLKNKKFKKFFNEKVYNVRYEEVLKKANLKLIPDEYFISIYVTIFGFLSIFILTAIIFLFIDFALSVASLFGGVFILSFLGISLYNYPLILSNSRAQEIDASMPYLLPYLKILSKEVGLAKMVDIIEDFLIYKEIRVEFKRIKYYYTFLGYDLHSSIREAMLACPSKQLSDLMNDLVTISNSGGDMYKYLDRKLSHLNQEIEAIEKKNIDTLLIYSQIYVVILLIAPLFFTIMSAILSLVDLTAGAGGGGGGGSITNIFILLFALIFLYSGFMMLIYYSKPLYSRLQPIQEK